MKSAVIVQSITALFLHETKCESRTKRPILTLYLCDKYITKQNLIMSKDRIRIQKTFPSGVSYDNVHATSLPVYFAAGWVLETPVIPPTSMSEQTLSLLNPSIEKTDAENKAETKTRKNGK